jgi:solute carrier family 50 protein (sugar transporter)
MANIIFPIFGLILVNGLGLNLFYSYYNNVYSTELTINNIFIFITFFFNSINWSIFALWYNDLWIFLGGICMPIGSILCIMLLYTTLNQNQKRKVELSFILGYFYILLYVILINYVPLSIDTKNYIVNYSLLFNIFYFISPLSSILSIIESKSTKMLYLPFTIINMIASSLWLIYGIMLNNYFLISIYSLGIVTSFTETILYFHYNLGCGKEPTVIVLDA